jgi:hypothetical protein
MTNLDRRGFLASAGALSLACFPGVAEAQTACVTGAYPPFLPNRLTVDCASRQNFRLFRQNPDYLGLTGVVSMTSVRSKYGTFPSGNLFLFPWLKPKGRAFGASKNWGSAVSTGATTVASMSPIPNEYLPPDEYFCRVVMAITPLTTCIGVWVDVPHAATNANGMWLSNTPKLADGNAVGIDWTSSNLNNPWFGGSRWIPNADDCQGNAWRNLITDGINQASAGLCAA